MTGDDTLGTKDIILLSASTILSVLFIILFFLARSQYIADPTPENKKRKKRRFVLVVLFSWVFVGSVFSVLIGESKGFAFDLNIFSTRTNLAVSGYNISQTSITMWVLTGIILLLSLIFRIFVFPRFREQPKGFQNIMELGVEAMDKFAKNTLCDYSEEIAPYMFSLIVFMLLSAASELVDVRSPTSDPAVTMAMGLISFVLINFYGFRKKGFVGRWQSMSKPNPVILPFKLISDVAVPISLACRLFGNMLGGMIILGLIKGVLGGYGIGVIPVVGLYFSLFHPLIQIYIFIILSMTFINEAIENEDA